MPGTHKALFLTLKSGPFAVQDTPTPKPGPGEVLVRIEATGLNVIEWKIQLYGGIGTVPPSYPAILGHDIAGVVVELGEGVSGLSKGDRVFYQGSWSNEKTGFQQYNLVNAEFTSKIPAGVSFEDAATLPCAVAAAAVGLYSDKGKGDGAGFTIPLDEGARGKYAGQPLLVLGGASSVGQSVIQFARLSGFSPILTTASPHNAALLKSLGATHVLDRHLPTPALASAIAQITSAPLKIAFDGVSLPETQQAGYDLLAEGGHLVLVLPDEIKKREGKNVTAGFIYGVWELPNVRELGLVLHPKLSGLLEKGLIKPNRVEVLPGGLRGIVGGLERLKAGEVSAMKLVVRPQETV
ncbi:chaperonin 10-like protein [Lyophyllum atratum]|nr:chaperonin 10-like protein [Lyophyllum atratum]